MMHFHCFKSELIPYGWNKDAFVYTRHINSVKNGKYIPAFIPAEKVRGNYYVPWKDKNGDYHSYVWINDDKDIKWIYASPEEPSWKKYYDINLVCNLKLLCAEDATEEIELMSPEEWAQLMKYGPGYYNKYVRKCECGSEKVYGDKATHSHWCPKHESHS